MGRLKRHIICSVLLTLTAAGCATSNHKYQGRATIATAVGASNCEFGDTQTPAKPNEELAVGATVVTQPDSFVYLRIKGSLSTISIQPETVLKISSMDADGTVLELKSGTIFGRVGKLPPRATYKIETPDGVAEVREAADFKIDAFRSADNKPLTTFTCVKGVIIVSAIVDGNSVTRTLRHRQVLAHGEREPRPLRPDVIKSWSPPVVRGMTS
jgi:hypothetical protein